MWLSVLVWSTASALVFAPRRRGAVRVAPVRSLGVDDEFVVPEPLSSRPVDFLDVLRAPGGDNVTVDYFGESQWSDLAAPAGDVEASLEETLRELRRGGAAAIPPEQQVFCSRSLNLRGIKVIGYDMDYTIVHYKWREWETLAYVRRRVDRRAPNANLPVSRTGTSAPRRCSRGSGSPWGTCGSTTTTSRAAASSSTASAETS